MIGIVTWMLSQVNCGRSVQHLIIFLETRYKERDKIEVVKVIYCRVGVVWITDDK